MQGIPQGQNQGGSQKPSLSWQSPAPGAQNKPPVSGSNKPKPPVDAPKATQGKSDSNMGMYAGIFVAGLIIGGLLGWAITGQRMTPGTASNSTTTPSGVTAPDLTGSDMGALQGLAVDSGQAAGGTVAISHISVTQPTWVVIYDNESGFPGRALGAQLFFAPAVGGATSGTVTLTRNTLEGYTYLAGERIDDGDHAYGPASDKLVTDANGNPLTIKFSIK